MHSVPCAAGGITVPIDAVWSARLRAAPVPPNATSWGCLGKKHVDACMGSVGMM